MGTARTIDGATVSAEDYSKLLQELGADAICGGLKALVDCRVFLTPFIVSGTVGCLCE
jgi:hypothetical protein